MLVATTCKRIGSAQNVIHIGTIGIAINAERLTTFFVGLGLDTLAVAVKAVDAAALKMEQSSAAAKNVKTFMP